MLGVDSPIFKFHSRMEKAISLHNFPLITEDEIIRMFRENQISVVEFTARKKEDKGLEYLEIYVETSSSENAERIQQKIHRSFYSKNRDYRDLVDFFDFIPLKIHLISRGIFAKYLSTLKANISKVDRMNMKDDEFYKFSQLII